ncbi:DNA cytosine methyltransferase [Nonomuraea sp. NPDC001684]
MCKDRRTLRSLEICVGAGGQALGLERAGFEPEIMVELDQGAVNTIRYNRPYWKVIQGDVTDPMVFDPTDYTPGPGCEPIDLMAGGVPCPPFSSAGKQLGATDERDLFAWAVEQVGIVRPRALMLENVRGMSEPRFTGYRQHVLDRLQGFGYVVEWKILQASDYGVPQLRPRFILIAMAPEDFAYFHWPEKQVPPPSVGETLLPLISANGWEGAQEWAEQANRIAPTIVGGSKKHGGADLGPSRSKKAWAEMRVDGWTIADDAPHPGQVFSGGKQVGPQLTCEMVARLQGWNEGEFSWTFTGRKTMRYRQIGNAFPPPVAKAVGLSVAAALNRTADRREVNAGIAYDPIYRVLREKNNFLTARQVAGSIGFNLSLQEIERRIDTLGNDFYIEIRDDGTEMAYRLGGFKGFVGR